MKVTKLIREYVESEVSKIYDSKVNPYTEQAKDDADVIQAFKEKLIAQQKSTIDEFMAVTDLFDIDHYGNVHHFKYSASIPSFCHAKTQAMIEEMKWNTENKRAKNEKIREIILSLELGASRQELIDMIAKLTEDV